MLKHRLFYHTDVRLDDFCEITNWRGFDLWPTSHYIFTNKRLWHTCVTAPVGEQNSGVEHLDNITQSLG